jgi:hypothetical protein
MMRLISWIGNDDDELIVLLEADKAKQLEKKDQNSKLDSQSISQIVAMGFFDLEYASAWPSNIWAMSDTTSEGLLLEEIPDPCPRNTGSVVYRRLGVYTVGSCCYDPLDSREGHDINLSIDNLVKETITLV